MEIIIPQDDTPRKQCNACLNFYPATLAYFHKGAKRNKFGLATKCKNCRGKATNFGTVVEPREQRLDEKQCAKCEEWRPKNTDYFGIDRTRKDGFNPYCKECNQKDREKRQETIDQQQKAYRINNRESLLVRDRKRYKRDREKRSKESRNNYRKHMAERKAYVRRWNASHKENRRISSLNYYVRKRGVMGSYTPKQIQEQLKRQNYRCYYGACGFAQFEQRGGRYVFHVEHTYPISRVTEQGIPANDMSYIVLACPSCNMQKNDKFPWEWFEGGRLL